MRLQAFFAMSASFLGSLGIVTAVSLVWTTSVLRQGTFELGEAIESVRAAEELELSLLVHDHEWAIGGVPPLERRGPPGEAAPGDRGGRRVDGAERPAGASGARSGGADQRRGQSDRHGRRAASRRRHRRRDRRGTRAALPSPPRASRGHHEIQEWDKAQRLRRFGVQELREIESRRAMGRISRQTDRLSRIVEDLLDRTRIRCGVLELQIEECELRELAAEVVEVHRTVSERHSFDFVQPDEPIVLRCDPTRVSQVLTNLVTNAIKYSPDGGRIRVRVDAENRRALLEVSDEGLGIPETERERIFEPFGRSESVPRGIPGAGLGLYVSRRIVHAHGGSISVESAPGIGTTFRIQLPQAVPGEAPIGATP